MKTLALDIGDSWTGIAISDALGLLARPYKTVAAKELGATIETLIREQQLGTIVVGYPKTMKGTHSAQTTKIVATFESLKIKHPSVTWVLWDERMTSKQASVIKRQKNKEDKLQQHAIAAALILGSYLDYVRLQNQPSE